MIQTLALVAGVGALGYGIYKLIEDINKETKVVNNTYNKISNTYNQMTSISYNNYVIQKNIHIHIHKHYNKRVKNNSKDKIKRLHDILFQNWVKLKKGLNKIENKKREVYKKLKGKNLSKKQKSTIAKILKELKRQSIEIRNVKQEAHQKWQNARRLLLA